MDRYKVEWERDTSVGECSNEDEGSTTIFDGPTSYVIRGLEEDSTYTITVRANFVARSAVIESVSGVTREAGKLLYTQI